MLSNAISECFEAAQRASEHEKLWKGCDQDAACIQSHKKSDDAGDCGTRSKTGSQSVNQTDQKQGQRSEAAPGAHPRTGQRSHIYPEFHWY